MDARKQKAIHLMVTTNMTQKKIAEEVEVSENTITAWKKDERFQKEKRKYEEKYFNNLASPALRRLKELINSENDHTSLNAVTYILDNAGFKLADKLELQADVKTEDVGQVEVIETKANKELLRSIYNQLFIEKNEERDRANGDSDE